MGLAVGWNITNVGAVAEPLAAAYGVGLGVVGLFTTALFLAHASVQIPSGRLADRRGARPVALAALALVAAGNGLALLAPDPWLAASLRAAIGIGSGAAFVAGSDYVRSAGGGPVGQGFFGGAAMGGGGLALAAVPALESWLSWRAPFLTAAAAAGLALVLLALAPRAPGPSLHAARASLRELVADRRLHPLAVLHMASLGLNAVVANWSVTLLVRTSDLSLAAAGLVGALTLVAGVAGRPFGGWLAARNPEGVRAQLAASVVLGAGGTALLAAGEPPVLAATAAALLGLGAGLAFAPVFAAAAAARPEAPGAAVGVVNMAGNLVIVAGTPLLGLAFSLPGDGRTGFVAAALLWAAVLLVLRRPVTSAPASPLKGQLD